LNNLVQNIISFYASLAPIAQIGHQKTTLKYLDTDSKELERYWHKLFGRNEFLPSSNGPENMHVAKFSSID
jgi:hypothetical protein